ncbi:MAG TPA: hypothetical protein VKX17_23055 [Planctomycetota bacterium]|nr:hypothetical protein [Planctomycetota bacterium]
MLGSYASARSASQRYTKMSDSKIARDYADATIGGPLGWLAGAGILPINGAGAFIAAGPIMILLSSSNARGTSPVVANSLLDLGLPKSDAGRYAGRVARGALLIAVHCSDEQGSTLAEEILKESCAGSIGAYAVKNEIALPVPA